MSRDGRRPVLTIVLIALLVFLGVSGVFGGAAFIAAPDGHLIDAPPMWLDRIPFRDFLVPGLLLGVVIGVPSLLVAAALIWRPRCRPLQALSWPGHYWGWTAVGLPGFGIIVFELVELTMIPVPDETAPSTATGMVGGTDVKIRDSWPYGGVHVLEQLWKELDLAAVLARCIKSRGTKQPFERALFAMVANRALSPYSKLYCWEQWLREEAFLPSGGELELQHLYRAMDFLEENKAEIEKAVYFKVADLMNVDVDLIFYDTTSLHFEVDDEDEHPHHLLRWGHQPLPQWRRTDPLQSSP